MQPGDVVHGRFRLLQQLGKGGMGSVWLAEQTDLRRKLALKLLHNAKDKNFRERFRREAIVMARLNHPHAVKVFEFGEDGDAMFLAMELIEGGSLDAYVKKHGPLSFDALVQVITQTAQVLDAAHESGVVHRDIKPANLMLDTKPNDELFVRVVDFGIAGVTDPELAFDKLTREGFVAGTATYMAPEQCREEPTDARTDTYALGCVVYELLTGKPPFQAPSAADLMSSHLFRVPPPPSSKAPARGIPAATDAVVLRALAKHPDQRHRTTGAFAADLAASFNQFTPRAQQHQARPDRPMPEASWPVASPEDPAVALFVAQGAVADCDMLTNALAAWGVRVEVITQLPASAEAGAVVIWAPDADQGLDACSRALAGGAPVVLCGNEEAFDAMTRAIGMGVFDYVPLPLDETDGARRVVRALRRPKKASP